MKGVGKAEAFSRISPIVILSRLQRRISVLYFGFSKQIFPRFLDVGLGSQHLFLFLYVAHCQRNLHHGFGNQAIRDLVEGGELSIVNFVHPGLTDPVDCVISSNFPFG